MRFMKRRSKEERGSCLLTLISSSCGCGGQDDPNNFFNRHALLQQPPNQSIPITIQKPILLNPINKFFNPCSDGNLIDIDLDEFGNGVTGLFGERADRKGCSFVAVEEDIAKEQGEYVVQLFFSEGVQGLLFRFEGEMPHDRGKIDVHHVDDTAIRTKEWRTSERGREEYSLTASTWKKSSIR